jgi:hypothetical protein
MSTINKLFFALLFNTIVLGLNAQTLVNQVISANETWTPKGSPYVINQNILIKSGAKVIVKPGTKIRSDLGTGSVRIIIEGGFEAIGTKDSMIQFDSTTFDYSKGSLGYDFTSKTGAQFTYCQFTGAGLTSFKTIQLNETKLMVSHCRFFNCYYAIFDNNGKKVRIENSVFDNPKFNPGYAYYPSGSSLNELEMNECIVKNTYGMYLASFNLITKCDFYNWQASSGFSTDNRVKKATFKCNTFRKFRSSIFQINPVIASKMELIIVSNTFDSAEIFIDYWVSNSAFAKFVCKNNNFLHHNKNSVRIYGSASGFTDTLILTKNYWGTSSAIPIIKSIWDIKDDILLTGLVDFANYLPLPVNDCIDDESEEEFVGGDKSNSNKRIMLNEFSIFPNPSSQNIYLISNSIDFKYFKIYTLDGQLLMDASFKDNIPQIDISELSCGLYFLEISDGKTNLARKRLIIHR